MTVAETNNNSKTRGQFYTASWPWELPTPHEGKKLFPYQIPVIEFALVRNRSYLGLDPGTGKTIIGIMLAVAVENFVLYTTSPSLVLDVEKKFSDWAPELKIHRLSKYSSFEDVQFASVLICADTLFANPEIRDLIKRKAERHYSPTILIDEAHRYTSYKAQRTKDLLGHYSHPGIVDSFNRMVFMSGTPLNNRPMEFYPILNRAVPELIDYRTRHTFGTRYCAGFEGRWGWDYTGASNIDELKSKLDEFLIRLRKKDVLKELPPKIEEVVVIAEDLPPRLHKLDAKLKQEFGAAGLVRFSKNVKLKEAQEDEHIATYRRILGVEKVKYALDYIKARMEETDENLIVFAFHREVIEKLVEGLASFEPLLITGDTPVDKRFPIVEEYQNNPKRRLIIGNYIAMGLGFTLTKATREVFVEFSWVPGENDQASDRAHRIGQENTVNVDFLVYKNSLDNRIIDSLLSKREVLDRI